MPAADLWKTWSDETALDAVRLVAFQRWLALELGTRLVWPQDQATSYRQIGQVSAFIQVAVADLGRHGFLFRPSDLADYITEHLDHIATYQRQGAVRDLYAYLKRSWDGWVGRNAERLAQEARQKAVHRSNAPARRAPSMGEIVFKNLLARKQEIDDKRSFRREVSGARKRPCRGDATPLLPGF